MIQGIICVLIALCGGIAVGGGIVALITVLNIVSRLSQITDTWAHSKLYSYMILLGSLTASVLSLFDFSFYASSSYCIIIGLGMGISVGMLASALAEVIDVIPVSAKRLQVSNFLRLFILVLAIGKVVGSLLYWLVPGLQK